MKSLLCGWLFLLWFSLSCSSLFASEKGDQFFQKKLWGEAETEYAKAIKNQTGDRYYLSLYRLTEARSLQFRFAEALKGLRAEKPIANPLWKARVGILRTLVTQQYVQNYERGMASDSQGGDAEFKDITPAQWRAETQRLYESLWNTRSFLAGRSLRSESDFFDLNLVDVEAIPTLWDFVVLRWKEYVEESQRRDSAKAFSRTLVSETFPADLRPTDPPMIQLASVLEESYRMGGKERGVASELWRIERLLLAERQIAQNMSTDPDYKMHDEQKDHAEIARILFKWEKAFTQERSRARALQEAAGQLNSAGQAATAYQTCLDVEKRWKNSPFAKHCYDLRVGLALPRLSLSLSNVMSGVAPVIQASTRNLKKIYVRVIPTDKDQLATLGQEKSRENWWHLRRPSSVEALTKLPAEMKFEKEITEFTPYENLDRKFELSKLPSGLYAVLVSDEESFDPKRSLISGAILNVSDLMMLGSSGLKDPKSYNDPQEWVGYSTTGHRFYLINGKTGKPIPGADVDAYSRLEYRKVRRVETSTDRHGVAEFPLTFSADGVSSFIDPLGHFKGEVALLQSPSSFYFSLPEPLEIAVEFDRVVFRPGQKAKAKVTVLKRGLNTYRTADKGTAVQFVVNDPNGKKLFSKTLKINEFGSAATELEIPSGRLLGTYFGNARVKYNGKSLSGTSTFRVEEYKRPEFEVTLNSPESACRYDKACEVKGQVKYYFGSPVQGAALKYKIARQPFFPWWLHAWRGGGGFHETEVAFGELTTDDTGAFTIRFTPEADPQAVKFPESLPARFNVIVEARDAGGRTIEGSTVAMAGQSPVGMDIKFTKNFFLAKEKTEVNLRSLTLQERPVASSGKFSVVALTEKPKDDPSRAGRPEATLDEMFRDVPDGKVIHSGSFTTKVAGPTSVALGELPPGIYRLKVEGKDTAGNVVKGGEVFLVWDASAPAPSSPVAWSVALPAKDRYEVGEIAEFLVGSPQLKGDVFMEVWAGRRLLKTDHWENGGLKIVSLPVVDKYKGGFLLRWFGVEAGEVVTSATKVEVPWTDKTLKVAIDASKINRPGDQPTWKVKVTDAQKKPVEAEALVAVTDRSLDYYQASGAHWTSSLYGTGVTAESLEFPFRSPPTSDVYLDPYVLIERTVGKFDGKYTELRKPHLLVESNTLNVEMMQMAMADGAALEERSEPARPMAAPPASPSPMDRKELKRSVREKSANVMMETKGEPRSEFAETAVYSPQLRVKHGGGLLSFTFPDQLTSWTAKAFVITASGQVGEWNEALVTQKDLMVRVDLPRFLREDDKAKFEAIVSNESPKELSVNLMAVANRGGKDVSTELGLTGGGQVLKIKPHSSANTTITLQVPPGSEDFSVRVAAKAGGLSDSEERILPVLASRQRVVDSQVIALNGSETKQITVKVKPSEVERMDLQVDPTLVSTVFQSIPLLTKSMFESSESLVNRYVPLSIVQNLYAKYPDLQRTIASAKRTTELEPWKEDPRRLLKLSETPWMEIAEGGEKTGLTTFFSPAVVAKERQKAEEKLAALQFPDGSFPWIAGGQSDAYMTLVVLDNLATAQNHGAAVPETMARRAHEYLMNYFKKQTLTEGKLPLYLYAGYVLLQYQGRYKWAEETKALVAPWMAKVENYSNALTPYGKAFAAHIYRKLGDEAKSEEYLDRALSGMKSDPVVGNYFTPEAMSWLWYRDTDEKHAFMLRTLLTLRPKDERISGLVKWLLFNRKGNVWKSPKTTAVAVYSLLDFMKRGGELSTKQSFEVKWAGEDKRVQLDPFEVIKKPLRWNLDPRNGEIDKIEISKGGPGLAFASLTTRRVAAEFSGSSPDGMLVLDRRFFRREREGKEYRLHPLTDSDVVRAGDEIEVQIGIRSRSEFEYLTLDALRGAGFESAELTSGWNWDTLARYQEPKDSLDRFSIPWLPQGEYTLKYRLRAATPGTYRFGAAVLQSVYAPEIAGYSSSFSLNIQ